MYTVFLIPLQECIDILDFSLDIFICLERHFIFLNIRHSEMMSQTFMSFLAILGATKESLKKIFTVVIYTVSKVHFGAICFITQHYFLLQKLYKEAYERSKGTSMNYCETPKFQTDNALKNFSDVCISEFIYFRTDTLDCFSLSTCDCSSRWSTKMLIKRIFWDTIWAVLRTHIRYTVWKSRLWRVM